MKKFRVIETNVSEFINEEFEINTEISQHVTLAFTNDNYRCVMFDGIRVRLINEHTYIIGINV